MGRVFKRCAWLLAAFGIMVDVSIGAVSFEVYQAASRVPRLEKGLPNAEGFGGMTQGGKGGKVLKVTTLEDSGDPGSLRWAVKQPYPRIVQFAVEGIIDLNTNLIIEEPFLTLDGSTAPGRGVLLKDGTLFVHNTHDVIVTHMRVRPGDEVALKKGKWKKIGRKPSQIPLDAITVNGSTFVLIDHCSASWSSDEALSVVNCQNVTVQWCFITEPLANPKVHIEKGVPISHPYAALVWGSSISYVKNLIAYFMLRGPQFVCSITTPGFDPLAKKEAVNNYVYGYSTSASRIKIGDLPSQVHIIGNYYQKPLKSDALEFDFADDRSPNTKSDLLARVFLFQNLGPHLSSVNSDQWKPVKSEFSKQDLLLVRSDSPLFNSNVTTIATDQVPKVILAGAGATLPLRDLIDQRVVNQVQKNTGGLVYGQEDVGGYKF